MSKREQLTVGQLIMDRSADGNGGALLSKSLTPVSVAAASAAEQNFTIAGLKTSDIIVPLSNSTGNNTALVSARVSAANTLTCKFVNPTAGALTPGAGTYNFLVLRTA
jgi:hypothetical protein